MPWVMPSAVVERDVLGVGDGRILVDDLKAIAGREGGAAGQREYRASPSRSE
jgi:hypothetical protein